MSPTSSAVPVIDARGRPCPMPIVELARAARSAPQGAVLELWATDPAVEADLGAWCEATGSRLMWVRADGGVFRAQVRLGG